MSYEDDRRVLAEAAVDDYANHLAPLSARMSGGPLTMAWYGVASAIFYVVTAIYNFVFEGSIIAVAFQLQVGGNLKAWVAVVCVIGFLLVMRGVDKWLDKFNGALLPFYILSMVAAGIWAIADHGYSSDWWNVEGVATGGLPGWLGRSSPTWACGS